MKKTISKTADEINELRRELANLKIARRMNKLKISEVRQRIRAKKLQAKADKASSLANESVGKYYELAKRQTRNASVEKRIMLGVK